MKTPTPTASMAVGPIVGCHSNKLHRKHGRVVAGALSLAAALLAGATVAWSQAAHATAQERDVSLEAARCERVVQVLKDLLNSLSPWPGRSHHVTAETTCRHVLDETAKRIGEDLKGHPDLEAELRTTLGFIYNELDDGVKAEEMHRKALELRRTLAARPEHAPRVPATTPATPPVRNGWHGDEDPTVAASIYNLGQALLVQGRHREAKAISELASLIRQQGRDAEAELLLSELTTNGQGK